MHEEKISVWPLLYEELQQTAHKYTTLMLKVTRGEDTERSLYESDDVQKEFDGLCRTAFAIARDRPLLVDKPLMTHELAVLMMHYAATPALRGPLEKAKVKIESLKKPPSF